jgi:sigma-B regulation protein RsbU (phosphoserine phosphatase)
VAVAPGMQAALVVPLVYKGHAVGALNLLSRTKDAFCPADLPIVTQFGAHVAVALENARLFEVQAEDARIFETLAEIAHELTAILDLDALLERVGQLARRIIQFRTFGILLLDDEGGELEMALALQYGERVTVPRVRLGEGIVGYAALHRESVIVDDVSKDPRYIKILDDVRSELAVPLMLKDRCIGVLDLESPQIATFSKRDAEILALFAAQIAVAIENARLYEALRANEERRDRELRFAQRVQAALLPATLPKRLRGVDVAARFEPARELGGDLHDFLSPEAHTLVVAVGDVSGKGVPAALYGAFAGELIRGRTFRQRYTRVRATPGEVLASINTILHQRQLENYFCTVCYASFDLKRRTVTLANSGLPYPVRVREGRTEILELAGVPLGSFARTSYEQLSMPLVAGDLFVFCTDGAFEAMSPTGEDFGRERLEQVLAGVAMAPAATVVAAVFDAVDEFRDAAPQDDDVTVVAVRITA